MFEFDHIPADALKALSEHSIDVESIRLAAFCDRTEANERAEVYLFASRDALHILTAAPTRTDRARVFSACTHSLDELSQIHVEEQLTSGRLVACRGEEKVPVLLASFTNFCKDSVLLFAKYTEKLKKDGDFTVSEKDDPKNRCCPTCGMRYPNKDRAVCPRCMEKGKLFARFFVFLFRYRKELLISLLSLVFTTAAGILVPYFSSGFFYDEVIFGVGRFSGAILLVLGIIVGIRILRVLAQMVNNWVSSYVAAKMVFDLKKTIFSAIERLSLGFFTARQTGGLMTQVNEDANTIYGFFCDGVPYLLINIVQVVALIVLLFVIQPVLALFALLPVPFFLFLVYRIFNRTRRLQARRYSASRQMNSQLSDVFSGMRVVKAFSKEQEEITRFSAKNRRLADSDRRLGQFNGTVWPLASYVLQLGNLLALGVGGYMIITGTGELTYGLLLTVLAYTNMIYNPLVFFIDFISWTADCSNALQRLFEIMDAQPDVVEKEHALHPETLSGKVEFDTVSFSYEKGKKVIDAVSFEVPDGGVLGIVGHTGAGKSTLANLLLRMYDAEDGEIRIGGYPVKELALASIYEHVAIVSQETYLFMGSILENIRYARPSATYEEVIHAAKCAGAHDFIMKLPDAYDTMIGFGYQDLSGGERQRVSIARAILKDPKILILDEATAAMDTGTERRIQEALSELIKGKTTIMIAHRLSTLRDADELIVIEHGKVAERGTHKALLAREEGVYKKLYTLQEEALRRAGISE